jgi:hypothetical protein
MKSSKTSVLLIVAFFCSLAGYAQGKLTPGYIITNEKDTVRGFIFNSSRKGNHETCSFRKTEKSDTQVFTPADLFGYWMQGDIYYERKKIRQQNGLVSSIFAEALVTGKASLYELNDEFYLQRDSLQKIEQGERLVSLPGAPPQWTKTKKYIGTIRALTMDCQLENIDFDKMKYKPKDFVKVTEAYNNCLKSPFHSYKQELASSKTVFRLLSGLNLTQISFDFLPKNTFRNTHSMFYGAGLEFSSPRMSWKSAFLVELWYSKLNIEGTYNYPFNAFTRHDKYEINVNMLRIPIGLKHYLTKSAYLKGGGAFFVMRNKGSGITEVYESADSSTATFHEKFNKVSTGQLSIWGGIGIEAKISKRKRFHLELQYEKGTGIGRRTQFTNTYNNAMALVGISF